jgi:hypothetical protein
MESRQNTAAPAARSSGGTRPSSGSGPSGWSSRPPASEVNGSARSRGWPSSSAAAPSPCASGPPGRGRRREAFGPDERGARADEAARAREPRAASGQRDPQERRETQSSVGLGIEPPGLSQRPPSRLALFRTIYRSRHSGRRSRTRSSFANTLPTSPRPMRPSPPTPPTTTTTGSTPSSAGERRTSGSTARHSPTGASSTSSRAPRGTLNYLPRIKSATPGHSIRSGPSSALRLRIIPVASTESSSSASRIAAAR